MVALFVGLKLRLLRNGLKGSNTRLVLGVIGLLAGFGITVAGVALTIGLRSAEAGATRAILVVAGTVVVLGWTVLPVLFFGVDETVDPQRFTFMPIRRRQLLAGMLAAGCIGVPAITTALVSLATVVTWSRGALAPLFALAGAVLGTLLCVVASRAATTAVAGVFRSRRANDLVSVVVVLLVASIGLIQLGLTALARLATPDLFVDIVDVLAWTPFGAPWAAPYDAATGSPGAGLIKLAIAAAAVAVLLMVWGAALRRSLERGDAVPVGSSLPRGATLTPAWVASVLPSSPVGAVAARVLVYWWRDPRQRVALLIIPVVLTALLVGPQVAGGNDTVLVFTGPAIGTLLGLTMLNHTAYDGTALWAHLVAALPGTTDRAGRALGTAVWAVPLSGLAALASCLAAGRPELAPAALGGSAATVLAGLAIGSVTSVVIPFPAPPPSTNPFVSPSGGNVVTILQQLAGGLAVGVLALPVYGLVAAALWWDPAIGWLLLVGGPAYGWLLLRTGNRIGGRHMDQHGPELLRRVTPSRT